MCTYYVDMDGWMEGNGREFRGGSVTVLFCYDDDDGDDDDGVMGTIWFG